MLNSNCCSIASLTCKSSHLFQSILYLDCSLNFTFDLSDDTGDFKICELQVRRQFSARARAPVAPSSRRQAGVLFQSAAEQRQDSGFLVRQVFQI
jgi:hypothetical protein